MIFVVDTSPCENVGMILKSLQHPGAVSIKLYNYLGQEVKIIKEGNVTKGSHEEVINISSLGLASGAYFVKAEIGGNAYNQKIIIKE